MCAAEVYQLSADAPWPFRGFLNTVDVVRFRSEDGKQDSQGLERRSSSEQRCDYLALEHLRHQSRSIVLDLVITLVGVDPPGADDFLAQ